MSAHTVLVRGDRDHKLKKLSPGIHEAALGSTGVGVGDLCALLEAMR